MILQGKEDMRALMGLWRDSEDSNNLEGMARIRWIKRLGPQKLNF